jgi:hypothetical protein
MDALGFYDYTPIFGIYPANPNADSSTEAAIILSFNCQVVGTEDIPNAVFYVDDITLTIGVTY